MARAFPSVQRAKKVKLPALRCFPKWLMAGFKAIFFPGNNLEYRQCLITIIDKIYC